MGKVIRRVVIGGVVFFFFGPFIIDVAKEMAEEWQLLLEGWHNGKG